MKYQRILAIFFILFFFTHCEKDKNQYGYISGVLTGPEGVIAEVIVQVVKNQGIVKETVTDENGAFNIKIAPGVYTLKISIEGYEDISETVTVKLDEDLILNVDLNEITKVMGVLTDTYTSWPLSNATIAIMSTDLTSTVATTTTGNEGRFSFGNIPDGNYQLYYYNSIEVKYMPVKIEGETKLSLNLVGLDYSELTEDEINEYFSELLSQSLLNYCNVGNTSVDYFYMDEFAINGKVNVSGNNNGYADFTNITFFLFRNGDNDLIVDLGSSIGSYSYLQRYKIWVDFNRDGDFSDSNELILSESNYTPGSYNHIIDIGDSILPIYTTMRIAVDYYYSSSPQPCNYLQYGEFEDYGVLIL